MSHSRFAPSNAKAWVNCPAAVLACQTYPSPETDESREGDAAHWVAQNVAEGRTDIVPGMRAPNGVVVDADMVTGAEMYAAEVRGWFGGNGGLMSLERQIPMPTIHADAYGTPDCAIVSGHLRRLLITDYKYGRLHVDAYQNWQLVVYAEGERDEHERVSGLGTIEHFDFIVVQPRTHNPVRRWSCTRAELAILVKIARTAAAAADSTPHHASAGAHCVHCTGRAHCAAARRYAVGLYSMAMTVDLSRLPIEAVAVEMVHVRAAREALKSLDDAYTEILEGAINTGQEVWGWQMGTSYGHRAWTEETPKIKALGAAFGVALVEEKPVTPAEAERRLGKTAAPVVAALTYRPSTKKLSRVTDAQLSGIFDND